MFYLLFTATLALAAPRVVAIGDLHGDPDAARASLSLAGLTDGAGHWIGGNAILVQTGDVTDRGPSSRGVIEILRRLQVEARAAGGDVIGLLGNHELMNVKGDWRYVSSEDKAEYGSADARRLDLAPEGSMGQWIHASPMMTVVQDVVFVHGGISGQFATVPRPRLQGIRVADLVKEEAKGLSGGDGPLWYRGYFQQTEPRACEEVNAALAALGAKRMVMGHTRDGSHAIIVRCGGRIIGIDTGISAHYGGHLNVLEIRDGDAVAITASGRTDIPDP